MTIKLSQEFTVEFVGQLAVKLISKFTAELVGNMFVNLPIRFHLPWPFGDLGLVFLFDIGANIEVDLKFDV